MRFIKCFNTIQGEGLNLGRSATFVRFWGCNEKCPYCDEPEHKQKKLCNILTPEEVVEECIKFSDDTDMFVITGGEPTIQQLLPRFIKELKRARPKHTIAVETNGYNLGLAKNADFITLSPKNLTDFCKPSNSRYWYRVREVKIPAFDDLSYPLLQKVLGALGLINATIWLTCINHQNSIDNKHLIEALAYIQKHPRVRLNIQAHKVWGLQ